MNSEKQSTNLQMTLREVNRVGEGQKNVPKLRFKGYEDAWEQRKLGIDINVTSVKRVHQSDWETEGVPFYRARDIVSEFKGEEISEPIFVSKKTYEEFSRISGKVQADDLLVTGVGTIGVPYLVKSNNPLYFKDGNVIWIQNNKKLNGYFLFYTFITNPIQNFIRESAGTGTVGTLTIETCKRIPVFIPGKREQIAVGEFFQSLDNLITLHQRKYDALKSMKKTLLSKMFPKNGEDVPEIRFKEFTDAWEQRKLGEIVLSEIKGSAKAEMIGGDTPYLETNYLNGGECLFVDSENNVDTDDVIVLWDGSQAGTVYHGFSGALGSTFKAYKTKCLGLFIFQQLKKNQQTIYDKYRTPNIPHVIKTFKDEYDVMLTSEEEQNEIGRYFQQIDHLITLHQRKLDELKNIKKTLLQQMFV